jgi:Zinc-binding dehydrogenase
MSLASPRLRSLITSLATSRNGVAEHTTGRDGRYSRGARGRFGKRDVAVIGREFPLAEAPQAHRAVMEAGALGKIVLVTGK